MSSAVFFVMAFVAFALIHSLLASSRLKQFLFSRFQMLRFYYRLIYNFIALVTFSLFWFYAPVPDLLLYSVSGPLRWVMHAVQLAGALGLYFSLRRVGTGYFSGLQQMKDASNASTNYHLDEPVQQQLVFSGPFRYVRHPLYSFSLLILFFHPVMSLKWALFSLCSLLYFVMGSRLEERKLIARFGQRYASYRREVPALIPLPGRRFRK